MARRSVPLIQTEKCGGGEQRSARKEKAPTQQNLSPASRVRFASHQKSRPFGALLRNFFGVSPLTRGTNPAAPPSLFRPHRRRLIPHQFFYVFDCEWELGLPNPHPAHKPIIPEQSHQRPPSSADQQSGRHGGNEMGDDHKRRHIHRRPYQNTPDITKIVLPGGFGLDLKR